MLSTFKRRIAKLESAGKKVGPKSFDDFCTEVHDYVRRTGVSLDEAMTRFVRDVSTDDLKRFIKEADPRRGELRLTKEDPRSRNQTSEP